MSDDKIPLEQVLGDMYSVYGGPVSWAARDYYKRNYATPEEAVEMDRQDRYELIFATVFYISLLSMFVVLIVRHIG